MKSFRRFRAVKALCFSRLSVGKWAKGSIFPTNLLGAFASSVFRTRTSERQKSSRKCDIWTRLRHRSRQKKWRLDVRITKIPVGKRSIKALDELFVIELIMPHFFSSTNVTIVRTFPVNYRFGYQTVFNRSIPFLKRKTWSNVSFPNEQIQNDQFKINIFTISNWNEREKRMNSFVLFLASMYDFYTNADIFPTQFLSDRRCGRIT